MSSNYIIYEEQLKVLEKLAGNIQSEMPEYARDFKNVAKYQAKQAEHISRLLNDIRSNQKSESAGDLKPESQNCRIAESYDQLSDSNSDQPAAIRPDQLKGD